MGKIVDLGTGAPEKFAHLEGELCGNIALVSIANPVEFGDACAFLCSAQASYITGQTVYADGGRLPLNYTVPVAE